MIDYILEYDISAAIFLGVLLILYFTEPHLCDEQGRSFTALLTVCFTGCLFDVLGVALGRVPLQFSLPLLWFVNLTFLCLTQLLLPLALFYVVNMAGHTIRPLLRRQPWLALPFFVSIALILTTPATGWVCLFDARHRYGQGPLHILLYVGCLFYLVYFIVYVLRHRAAAWR